MKERVPYGSQKIGDDEWYDRSITEYKELMMLEMENRPLLLSVGGPDNLFVVEQKDERTQVLSNHALPDKIIESRRNKVVKSSHMKINAGTFTSYQLKQINPLYGQRCLLASGVNLSGLCVYRMSTDTDKIVKDCKRLFEAALAEPQFCQVDETTLILSKTVDDPAYSCDMVGDSIRQLRLSETNMSTCGSNLIPFAVACHSVALGLENTGLVVIYDLRTDSSAITLSGQSPNTKHYFASSRTTPQQPESKIVSTVSENGSVALYDLRSPASPLSTGKTTVERPSKINVSPNEKYISVSDRTGIIRIFSYSPEGLIEEFVHEGHVRMEHCSRSTECTDHVWFSNNTLISCASNKSLNIWQPNFDSS